MTATVARPAKPSCLELLKPVTWFAPMWAFCGVVSSGLGGNGRWHLIVAGILLTGPLVCGTSQAINDCCTRWVVRRIKRERHAVCHKA
jgi:chlorophyll/bacteriochlorophyll a synthase